MCRKLQTRTPLSRSMPIQYRYDAELCVIHVVATQVVSVEDRAGFVATVVRDPLMPVTSPILIDATLVLNPPTIKDVAPIGVLLQMLAGRFKCRIAYYVTGVGLVSPFTIAALASNLGHNQAQAFVDRAEALEWLRHG